MLFLLTHPFEKVSCVIFILQKGAEILLAMPYAGTSDSSRAAFKAFQEKHITKDTIFNKKYDLASIPSSASASDTSLSFKNISRGNSYVDLQRPSPFYRHENGSSESVRSSSEKFDYKELISLPNESTHAYSCNPLSPISLYVRLSILKRALDIMANDPDMLEESKAVEPLKRMKASNTADVTHVAHLQEMINEKNNEEDMVTLPKRGSVTKWNSHAATLEAFVSNSMDKSAQPNSKYGDLTNKDTKIPERPVQMQRAVSLAVLPQSISNHNNTSPFKKDFNFRGTQSGTKFRHNKDILEGLRKLLDDTLEKKSMSNASKLHKLSLLNIDKLDLTSVPTNGNDDTFNDVEEKGNKLKRALLDSLAEPFIEFGRENDNMQDDQYKKLNEQDLNINMSEVVRQYRYNKVLHPFTSGKNSAPQAIFTCSDQHPWNFKAANDLACLTFGINKNVLKALTLLDLIHTDCRNFALNKLISIQDDQDIVFSGEIIAIVQPNSENKAGLIWATIWARRIKGSLVCVFEKIPCDYADIMLNLDDFSVENINDSTGLLSNLDQSTENDIAVTESDELEKKKTVKFANEVHDIKKVSKSLSKLIKDVCTGNYDMDEDDKLVPLSIRVSNEINRRRYFTLNHSNYNISCAVSSSVLENELKLKIHSAAYQVGLFIIERETLKLVSCNKSICKNMFGYHTSEIINSDITTLIPDLAKILAFIQYQYPILDFSAEENRGLVLTEHFFRKIVSEMHSDPGSFYSSVGLDGVHKDGNNIKVDFQIRVLDENIFLLWISQTRDLLFENYDSNPSQLSMLKESELSLVSSRSSSSSSKRPTECLALSALKRIDSLAIADQGIEDETCEHNENRCNSIEKQSVATSNSNKEALPPKNSELKNTVDIIDNDLISDPAIRANIELARRYTNNKSDFVKEDNFKLDEEMIKKIVNTEIPEVANADSNLAPEELLKVLNIKEPIVIGAQKRKKKYTDFVVLQKMGEGAYGKVNLCIHKEKKYIVVIKMIFKERILVDTWVRDRKLGTIPSEIQILATINKRPHENILGLLDFFEDDDYYYLETPPHGQTGSVDLFDIIEFKSNMTEFEAKLIFKQIVSGIKHLHDQGIVHRDIKDENVIVDSKGFVKLIDFGSAAYVKSGPFDVFVGTIDYAAPEVLGGNPYEGKSQDIWAIGILLYTLIYKENPFYNIDEILEGELRFNDSADVSQECKALITKILNRCVRKRPTIDEICQDVWLQI